MAVATDTHGKGRADGPACLLFHGVGAYLKAPLTSLSVTLKPCPHTGLEVQAICPGQVTILPSTPLGDTQTPLGVTVARKPLSWDRSDSHGCLLCLTATMSLSCLPWWLSVHNLGDRGLELCAPWQGVCPHSQNEGEKITNGPDTSPPPSLSEPARHPRIPSSGHRAPEKNKKTASHAPNCQPLFKEVKAVTVFSSLPKIKMCLQYSLLSKIEAFYPSLLQNRDYTETFNLESI